MAIYRNVHVSFWDDNKVVDDFNPKDRYFMLYLLTNPHTNLIGCYEITVKQMSYELGYDAKTIKDLLDRAQNIHNVIIYSFETKELLVKNWAKYNWTKSIKLRKPIIEQIENIKDKKLKDYMLCIGYAYGITKKRYPMDTTDSDSVTDTDNNIIDYYSNNINLSISGIEYERLNTWIDYFGTEHYEVMKYAIDICLMNKAKNINYLEGILNNWKNSNFKTFNEIKESENKRVKEKKETPELFDYNWLEESGDSID